MNLSCDKNKRNEESTKNTTKEKSPCKHPRKEA